MCYHHEHEERKGRQQGGKSYKPDEIIIAKGKWRVVRKWRGRVVWHTVKKY